MSYFFKILIKYQGNFYPILFCGCFSFSVSVCATIYHFDTLAVQSFDAMVSEYVTNMADIGVADEENDISIVEHSQHQYHDLVRQALPTHQTKKVRAYLSPPPVPLHVRITTGAYHPDYLVCTEAQKHGVTSSFLDKIFFKQLDISVQRKTKTIRWLLMNVRKNFEEFTLNPLLQKRIIIYSSHDILISKVTCPPKTFSKRYQSIITFLEKLEKTPLGDLKRLRKLEILRNKCMQHFVKESIDNVFEELMKHRYLMLHESPLFQRIMYKKDKPKQKKQDHEHQITQNRIYSDPASRYILHLLSKMCKNPNTAVCFGVTPAGLVLWIELSPDRQHGFETDHQEILEQVHKKIEQGFLLFAQEQDKKMHAVKRKSLRTRSQTKAHKTMESFLNASIEEEIERSFFTIFIM